MPKTILPPGAKTFLSVETAEQLISALHGVYDNVMLDTSTSEYLTQLSIDLAAARPPALFNDDDLWRAVVKGVAYGPRHTREAVVNFVELIVGPKVSQVTTLNRNYYTHIEIDDPLNITTGPNASLTPYPVEEVLTHHLIFSSGTFISLPDLNVSYNINNLFSTYGNIVTLADGREALVDDTVRFTNTHDLDFLTELNHNIPQYGNLIFDKNSPTTEESASYDYYDRDLSGILKLREGLIPIELSRSKYIPIRTSTLNAPAITGDMSLLLLADTFFPENDPPVPTIDTGDVVSILSPAFAITGRTIFSVSKHEIIVNGGTPFPVIPPSPSITEVLYEITTAAYPGPPAHPGGSLDNARGTFISHKGKIINSTKLVDYSVDFTKLLNPFTDGTVATASTGAAANVSEPFSITINRGSDNEETLEVLSRVGTTLNLVADPTDVSGTKSLLRFNHAVGEPIEVFNAKTSASGTYYPLSAAGATTSVADAASTDILLLDATNPFVTQNGDTNYGDELEVIEDLVGANTGAIRTITTYGAVNAVSVSIAFPSPLGNCTYRIRKLYKGTIVPAAANADQELYVDDSSIFPEENFSVILDRGTPQEEVVWIGANDLTLNRLTVLNSDLGIAYLSKNHNFGMTVEAAQVFIPSCNWEIIETRATGEFTVAFEKECIPPIDSHGWYLHEETPFPLLDSSDSTEIGAVTGSTAGLPFLETTAVINVDDTTIEFNLDEFLRVFANPISEKEVVNPALIFRSGLAREPAGTEEEFFITTVNNVGRLVKNCVVGSFTIVSDVSYAHLDVLRLGTYNYKYPGQSENVLVNFSTGPDDKGNFDITLFATPLVYDHFYGESIIPVTMTVNVNSAFENAFPMVPFASRLSLLTTHQNYRHFDNLSTSTERTTTALGSTLKLVDDHQRFTHALIGEEVYITKTPLGAAPEGESRRIVAIGGLNSSELEFDVSTPFSAAIAVGTKYIIQPLLQSGDISEATEVPLGDVNSAFDPSLNSLNLNKWAGGHRSIYPGSYMFRLLDVFEDLVDQPTSAIGSVRIDPNSQDETAIYKFPGPKKLIAPPLVPWAEVAATGVDLNTLEVDLSVKNTIDAFIAAGSQIVGRGLEILAPDTRIDWRTVHRITNWDSGTSTLTVEPPLGEIVSFVITDRTAYRILGSGEALSPATMGAGGYLWVDYPELFPDKIQGDFHVTVDRANGGEDVQVTECVNSLGLHYGRFTIHVAESIGAIYPPGTSIELKVNKFTLNVPTTSLLSGGFYFGFGFQKELVKDKDVGMGKININETTDKLIAGVYHPVEYEYSSSTPDSILFGKYSVVKNNLKIPGNSLSSPVIRGVVESSVNGPLSAELSIRGLSFDPKLYKRYKDLIGASVTTVFSSLDAGSKLIHTIDSIDTSTNTFTMTPGITSGGPAVADGNIVSTLIEIHPTSTRVDDAERFDMGPYLLKGMGVPAQLANNFVCNNPGTNLEIKVAGPVSKALIGRKVLVTADGGGGIPIGEERTIVDVDADPATGPRMIVSPAFTDVTVATLEVAVFPEAARKPQFRNRIGGVYTGINYPDGFPTTFTQYPAGRDYGIVEEYVEYSSSSGNIYTTSETVYFRYDHPPSTKVIVGSGETTTEGFGNDYRPYLLGGNYLSLLFNEDIVNIKNLFCAAGIQCKTETTELGE